MARGDLIRSGANLVRGKFGSGQIYLFLGKIGSGQIYLVRGKIGSVQIYLVRGGPGTWFGAKLVRGKVVNKLVRGEPDNLVQGELASGSLWFGANTFGSGQAGNLVRGQLGSEQTWFGANLVWGKFGSGRAPKPWFKFAPGQT